jgi:DNA-binding response OmpR family regulator
MASILVATDADWMAAEIASVLSGPDISVRSVPSGALVRDEVAANPPDLVIVDLQISQMGGMAVSLDLRLEEGAGRLPHVPVLMLLDRRADVFLARRSKVQGWVLKPLDPIRLRKATRMLLAGGTYHDESFAPEPLVVAGPSGSVEGSGK